MIYSQCSHLVMSDYLTSLPTLTTSILPSNSRLNVKMRNTLWRSLISDGSLKHSVYRKLTHTVRYLNYRSFHHPRIKSSVCKSLVNRAYTISDEESISDVLQHLNTVLKQNNFPPDKIKLDPPPRRRNANVNIDKETVTSVCIRYIGLASHQIERILSNSNIKVYHCSNQKVHQLL